MRGIKWKDINQKFKNDFEKTLQYIEASLGQTDAQNLREYAKEIYKKITALNLTALGKKTLPPKGY